MKGQQEWQSQAIDVLNSLANKKDNAIILALVPTFDGKDKNVKIEDWIREIEKAHILTDMSEKRIALQCSSGTPSTYIEKNLDQTWAQMKKTLEN